MAQNQVGGIYVGTNKVFPGDVIYPPYIQATGGTITYDGRYKIHTFTSNGTFTITQASTRPIHYLNVGGGGGGALGDGSSAEGDRDWETYGFYIYHNK